MTVFQMTISQQALLAKQYDILCLHFKKIGQCIKKYSHTQIVLANYSSIRSIKKINHDFRKQSSKCVMLLLLLNNKALSDKHMIVTTKHIQVLRSIKLNEG